MKRDSDETLQARYANLRTQIPLMYALMLVNAFFLASATYGEVPAAHSLYIPAFLAFVVCARAAVWVLRRGKEVGPAQIRLYLKGTIAASIVIGGAFGGWAFLLLSEVDPVRATAVALYVFVSTISCCYCLQALPVAGALVLLFGALPVTVRLALTDDWYLRGFALTFVIAAGVILRTLANSHAAFQEALRSRAEMSELIAALQSSQEHYRHSVELNPQIPWIADATGALVELSPRWSALTGVANDRGLGWGWADAVHPEDLPAVRQVWKLALDAPGHRDADVRYRLRHADGSFRWYRARAFPRFDEERCVVAWYGTLEDIHDQVLAEKAVQDSEERYRLASLATNDVIWDLSLERDHIEWSGAVATVLGYPEALAGTSHKWWVERIHPDDRPRLLAQFANLDDRELVQWRHEFRFRAGDGCYLDLIARGHVVRDNNGQATRLIGSLQDVTSRKRHEEQLRWAAHYDSLTALPNRVLFSERLEAALNNVRENGGIVALVVLDVDRFKATNDNLGHDAGDALLREIADRLKRSAPASSTVARLGGDEFAIILPHSGSPIAGVVDDLLAAVAGPVCFKGRQLEVSLSAGFAIAFSDGEDSEKLHKSADLALYAAKKEGPGRIRRFEDNLRAAAAREMQMLQDAREALLGDRIVPFYQPKVCLRTGTCVGFEALLRWHHDRGLRSPAAIEAALEDPNISANLTDRMLDRVIADVRHWQDSGIEIGRIAINGAAGDFRRGDFADRILERLHRAGLPPSALELEVTESVFIGQLVETVSLTLSVLSKAGVKIALDDFGTGYASLTHLKQFPVDTLKIDRSFISRLDTADRENAAIVRAVIDLAKSLGISTVAEGIETLAQAGLLAEMRCDIGQGFLFGRPMAGVHAGEVARNWNASAALTAIATGAGPQSYTG